MKALRVVFLCLIVIGLSEPLRFAQANVDSQPSASHPSPRFHPDSDTASAVMRAATQARIDQQWAERVSHAAGTPVSSRQARLQRANWTLMIYLAADNDLEEYALGDLDEMEVVGSTAGVNVLVQLDRAAGYDSSNGNWTDTRRFFVTRDPNRNIINSEMVQSLGETDTGDPATLVDFATWGMRTYPADHYALIIWDHGGSWMGVATDASAGDDDMNMPEVGQALSQIVAANNGAPLDLIGFDACLMGEFEVYRTIAPYGLYGVAAEETIPGFGWEYIGPLDALARNPSLDGLTLARTFVDSYMTFYTETVNYYDVFDLGAVDLRLSDSVYTALGDFANAVAANPGAVLSAIGDARNNTIMFGGFDDPQYFDLWSAADLIQFMELLSGFSPDPTVSQAAQRVVTAATQMVVHYRANEGLRGAQGISIFFPRNLRAFTQYDLAARYAEESPSGMVPWRRFLDVFYGTATETVTTAPQVRILSVYPEVASIYQPSTIQLEVSGRDILDVTFGASLERPDGTSILVDYERLESRTRMPTGEEVVEWPDGASTRNFIWDTEVPLITDGTVEIPAVLIQHRENPTSAVVDGRVIPQDGQPVDAQLVYDLTTGTVTSVWGVRETVSGFVPFELAVKPGDSFQPYWLYLDANHELSARPADATLTFSTVPFTYRLAPAPTGTYMLSIVAENITGTTVLDRIEVQVNNEGLDASQRGYTDLEFGLNFRYPATWIEPRFIQTDGGGRLLTGDPATETILTVLPYDGVSSAQDVAQQVINSWNVLENAQLVNQQQVTVSGHDAYEVDYTYTLNGQERVGAVLAIYVPEQGIGYGFDLDAPAEEMDAASAAFRILVDSVNFFNARRRLDPATG